MKGTPALFIVVFIMIVIGFLGIMLISTYNGLVIVDKQVEEAQGQIAAVCQRRLDLIPNLIETVKAYAAHEKSTLTAITQARANAQSALDGISMSDKSDNDQIKQLAVAQAGLSTAVRGFFAVVENYPDIRASANFLALSDQFEGTENRISVARQRFNSAVKQYNVKIETFPGVIIAPMFGFGERVYYEADDQAAYKGIKASF